MYLVRVRMSENEVYLPTITIYVMRMMINQCIEGFEAFQIKIATWSSLTAFCQGSSSYRMIGKPWEVVDDPPGLSP